MYDVGVGVRRNREQAMYWYKRAYRRGAASAALNIGTMHRDEGDSGRAEQWFLRALKLRDDGGAFELGKLLLSSEPVRARKFLQRAARSKTRCSECCGRAKAIGLNREALAAPVRLKPDTTICATEVEPYRGASAAGSAGAANNRSRRDSDSGQNTRAGYLREDQTWSERHDRNQQMPATCFAAPTFLFAEPVLPDADAGEAGLTTYAKATAVKKPCATACAMRDHGPAKAGHYFCATEVEPYRGASAAGSAGEANNRSRRDSDSGQNTRAGHLREDQTWSERHDSNQQMPATCFAVPTFLFAEPVLPAADAGEAGLPALLTSQISRSLDP
jgi:hypothetical protein